MNLAAYLLQTSQFGPWRLNAACFDAPLEWFFPFDTAVVTPQASSLCGGCMVRGECLDYAIAQDRLVGTWGGKSEAQIVALRRGRRG